MATPIRTRRFHVKAKSKKCYKPPVHHTASLGVLVASILVLIALVEYGYRSLPHESWKAPKIVGDSTSAIVDEVTKYLGSTPILKHRQDVSAAAALTELYLTPTAVTSTLAADFGAQHSTGVSTVPPAALTPDPSSYLDNGISTESIADGSAAAAPTELYLTPTVVTSTLAADFGAQHFTGVSTVPPAALTPDPSSYIDNGISTESSESYLELPSPPSTTAGAYLVPVITTRSAPSSATLSALVVVPAQSAAPSHYLHSSIVTTSATSPNAPAASLTAVYSHVYHPLMNLTGARYFVGAYLATLLATILKTFVGWLYSTTKMLDPFFYLARPEGASAKDFFHTNYLSTNDVWTPLMSLFDGHWLMLWTSGLYTVTVIVTPFATELLHFSKYCYWNDSNLLICGPEMRINPTVARIIQACLAFTLGLLFNVWILLRRKRSGVYSDPSSIVTIASLLHDPEVIADFRNISPGASKKGILQAVGAEKRYQLNTYHCADATERYGLIAVGGQPQTEHLHPRKAYERVANSGNAAEVSDAEGGSGQRKRHMVVHLIRDVIFGVATAGLLVLITYYYKVGADSGFERFMDSGNFGPRFVLAIGGIIIQSQWRRLEREVAILAPFRLLHLRPSPASHTILAERTLTPLTTFSTALYRRSFFVAHVALVALLSEVLVVVLPGIPFSAGQLDGAFLASAYVSMAVLAVMLLSLAAIWCRRGDPKLPRTPNTVAAVLSYLCAGRMTEDFAGFARMAPEKRNQIVEDLGREYVFDVGRGVDGVVRWGVDYANGGEGRAKGKE